MSTLEFVSTSAGGITEGDAPLVTAPALVAALGTHPTLTAPLVSGRAIGAGLIWRRLEEAARFFGVDIPPVTVLQETLQNLVTEARRRHGPITLAARISVVELDGRSEFLVSASVIDPVRPEPVALTVTPDPPTGPVPHWRRMAARTSSHAESDLTERELRAGGHADEVRVDGELVYPPRLGALLVDSADGVLGAGADHLELAREAGLLPAVTYSDAPVAISVATRAWWVSPRFETHPVNAIGDRRFEVVPA